MFGLRRSSVEVRSQFFQLLSGKVPAAVAGRMYVSSSYEAPEQSAAFAVPEHVRDFVESFASPARQLALRLA
jgi:hypothetical protein